ncbi:CoA transferase [Rhodobacterales bacterium 52_120_T64]|nr:CoA transferase [Rhodobacterales bacterium 52_120_T64]
MTDTQKALQDGPLTGLTVIDLTRVIAGPLATQTLGDLGADVIKIERHITGDDNRAVGPPWMSDKNGETLDQSTYFHSVNRNKRSIIVDYRKPEGADLIRKLASTADIFVENYRPGTLAKYGLGYEELSKLNPRLIYCSVSGFGQTGPYSSRSGYDYLAQAMSGAMSVTGLADGQPGEGPLRVGIPMADIMSAMQATIGILAAANARSISGKGQHIDVSLFETQFAALLNPVASYLNAGVELPRMGNNHPSAVPYGVFPVDDGHIVIATFNDREFIRLAKVLGHPEWCDDDRYNTNGARVENRDLIRGEIIEALKGTQKDDWVRIMNEATVSCGPINSIPDMENDPHMLARDMIVSQPHQRMGVVRSPGLPIKLSDTPATYRHVAPELGQHSAEILRDALGLSEEEIDGLFKRGVI